MPGLQYILVILMPLFLAGSAVCSSSETALFSLTQADKIRLRKISPGAYNAVAKLMRSPRALIIALLLGNVFTNSAYYVASAAAGATIFESWGAAIFSVGALLAIILFGEVLPKSIAVAHRVWLSRLIALPLLGWFRLTRPIHSFAEKFLIAPTVRVLTPSSANTDQSLSVDELAAVLEAGGREGILAIDEQRLLSDVLRLSAVRVRDVMVPRVAIAWLHATASIQDVLDLTKDTGFATFPVCRGELTPGSMVGVVGTRQLLPFLNRNAAAPSAPLINLVEPLRYVPERAKLNQLLEHFRTTKTDTAMCVNEAGDITGFVQLDSVIGEVVGINVAGEAMTPDEPQVRMIGLGVWEVPGRLSVRDWAEFFGERSVAADPRVSTISGLMIVKLGRLPKVGEECTLGELRLKVEAMDGRVVERALVSLVARRDSPQSVPLNEHKGAPPS